MKHWTRGSKAYLICTALFKLVFQPLFPSVILRKPRVYIGCKLRDSQLEYYDIDMGNSLLLGVVLCTGRWLGALLASV